MEKDWIFRTDEYICDLRTVGVLVRNGKLLVQRDRDGNEYALPGGHVKIGETTVDGLVREYKEETGADIKVGKLLWTEECFWEWNGRTAHNLAFYYLIEDNSTIPDTGEFTSHKGKSIFQQILEDKRAIRQCIQSGGDIKKIAQERGIKFATPI